MNDPINHPSHYTQNGIECIDIIRAYLTPAEYRGFLLGNAIKYVVRCEHKANMLQDIRKAGWYLKRLESEITSPDESAVEDKP